MICTPIGQSPNSKPIVYPIDELKIIQNYFSTGVTLNELSSIATAISLTTPIPKPTRNERRGLSSILQWFRRYWVIIRPLLQYIHLYDQNYREISAQTQIQIAKDS